jgi:hypothetical protein
VQITEWVPESRFWHVEYEDGDSEDIYKQEYGFCTFPALLKTSIYTEPYHDLQRALATSPMLICFSVPNSCSAEADSFICLSSGCFVFLKRSLIAKAKASLRLQPPALEGTSVAALLLEGMHCHNQPLQELEN